MFNILLAIHCPTKELYLEVLEYIDLKFPRRRGVYEDGGARGIPYPSEIHGIHMMEKGELCVTLNWKGDQVFIDLGWLSKCRQLGYCVVVEACKYLKN